MEKTRPVSGRPPLTFTVNGQPVETAEQSLTIRAILALAELDPEAHYLVEQHGEGKEIEYRNLDEEIRVHPHQAFLAFYVAATPVS